MNHNCKKEYLEKYKILEVSLLRAVKSQNDTYWIFWSQVGEVINLSDMPIESKIDCFKVLMESFGTNAYLYDEICSAVICKKYSTEFDRIQHEYCFSERLINLGDCWKDLIWNQRMTRCRIVGNWLRGFDSEIMPVINKMITKFEMDLKDRGVITEYSMKNRQEDYRSYKKAWKKIYDKWGTICELMAFIQTDPEYLRKMRLVFFMGVRER